MTDRVISSTDQLHVLEFELPPGGWFRHTADNPTLFAADVAYLCVAGTLVLADPASGETAVAAAGSGLYFGRDTWHHGFCLGAETTRVVEFMSPPPSRGTASTYGRTQPVLETVSHADTRWAGRWPQALDEQRAARRFLPLRAEDALLSFRDDSPAHLVGTLLDTPFLTVTSGTVQPGWIDRFRLLSEEVVLRVVEGELWVDCRTTGGDEPGYWVRCLQAGDACFLPAGQEMRLLVRAASPARYLQGSARVPADWHL